MPKIACPVCGASVIAMPIGHTAELRETQNAAACLELDASRGGLDGCRAMRASVASVLESLTEPSLAALRSVDAADNRLYERWRPLVGTLRSGSKHYACVVLDISPGGAAVWTEASGEVPEGAAVLFEPQGHAAAPAEVVRLSGGVLGLMFLLEADARRELAQWLGGLRDAYSSTG